MCTATLAGILDGVPVGEIHRSGGEQLEFHYDDYRASSGAIPLSLCMPVTRRAHTDRRISPWLCQCCQTAKLSEGLLRGNGASSSSAWRARRRTQV